MNSERLQPQAVLFQGVSLRFSWQPVIGYEAFLGRISTDDALQRGIVLRRLLRTDASPASPPSPADVAIIVLEFITTRLRAFPICPVDTNSKKKKNYLFFLSMFPFGRLNSWSEGRKGSRSSVAEELNSQILSLEQNFPSIAFVK